MNEIVAVEVQGEARISTRDLSARMENAHKNVMSLIRDYEADFKSLGRVAFETRPFETAGGTQYGTLAMLNEDQCYFLLTLVRNTEATITMKRDLVKAFSKIRAELAVLRSAVVLSPAQQALMAAQALVNLEQRMEALEDQTAQQRQRADNLPIAHHPDEEAMIHTLCQELGKIMPGGFPAAYRAFKAHFGTAGVPLAKYSSLPFFRYEEACGYLRGLIAQHSKGRLLEREA